MSAYTYLCVYVYVCVCIYIYVCVFLYVYVFAKGCTFVSLSVCAGGEWWSVVCLCVEGPGCFPDFSWELQWSMSSAENSKSKPPTSRMAIHWRHQPSPWPAAAWAAGWWNRLLTRASCLAVSQNRNYKVFSGSSEYLLFSDELLYIYILSITLVLFQCKVTILLTLFKLAPPHPRTPFTCTQRATAAIKYNPSPSRRYTK